MPVTKKARSYIMEAHSGLQQKSIPLKTFQTTVGRLRNAALILPVARGFFSPLNSIMKATTKVICLGADAWAAILDVCTLIHSLSKRPTHVNEIIPDPPSYVAYHDACADGAGGVWFSLIDNMQPVLWQVELPRNIAYDVISKGNPGGSITHSDLELAAEMMAVGIILTKAPEVKHHTLGKLCNNSPTVSWVERMASRSVFPTAGQLLRELAHMLHSCHSRGFIKCTSREWNMSWQTLHNTKPKPWRCLHLPHPTCPTKNFAHPLTLHFPYQIIRCGRKCKFQIG